MMADLFDSITITSKQNQYIKFTRSLTEKKSRDLEKASVAEGEKVISQIFSFNTGIRYLFYTKQEFEKDSAKSLIGKICKTSAQTFLIDTPLMEYISTTETPQGLLAVIDTKPHKKFDMDTSGNSCILILDNIQDPGNIGSIFRTAYSFGISGIINYGYGADIYNPKTVRSSAGIVFGINSCSINPDNLKHIEAIKKKGVKLLSTSAKTGVSILDADLTPPLAFILGNEGHGISEKLQSLSDASVRIPLKQEIDSLNVSVVSALLCFKFYENLKIIQKGDSL